MTYQQLLKGVNEISKVNKEDKANTYSEFAINTIAAIVRNIDIILVDYRNSSKEILGEQINVNKKHLSLDGLIDRVMNSTSRIGIYSSGTEGEPKLIYQTVARLLKSVRTDSTYTNSVWGFTYNPSHSAGIQMLLQVLCNKATLVDLYKSSRKSILGLIDALKINYLSATPTFYRMLAPYDFKFDNVKSITFNGEKSTIELIENIKSCFPKARVRNIYGSTEAGPLMSSEATTFRVPERLLGKLKIVADELLIHNSLVSKSVVDKEWYPTGDLVEVVREDPLTIKFISRKSRILNVGGQNVNPQEVEETLLSHPCVKDARVFGRKNKLIGNLITAEIQMLGSTTEKEMMDYCKQHLANYKVPRIIKFVEEIQTGRTGKKIL